MFSPGLESLTKMKPANWRHVIDVNLTGVFICLKHELGAIAEDGSIVNVASSAGLAGVEDYGSYVASKHGIIGLSKVAAMEAAAKRVTVNAVCP